MSFRKDFKSDPVGYLLLLAVVLLVLGVRLWAGAFDGDYYRP